MLSFKIETRSCKAKLYVTDHFRNQNSLNVDVKKFRWFLDIIFSNHKVTDFEINSYNSFNTLISKNAKIVDIPIPM